MEKSEPSCNYKTPSSSNSDGEEVPSNKDPVAKKAKYNQNYNCRWEEIPELKGWLKTSKKVFL